MCCSASIAADLPHKPDPVMPLAAAICCLLRASWAMTWLHLHSELQLQAGAKVLAGIRRCYADHLYAKHDFESAMAQYRETIGQLEPSYVIRKFLDAQRIHNLTEYLEELHDKVWLETAEQ